MLEARYVKFYARVWPDGKSRKHSLFKDGQFLRLILKQFGSNVASCEKERSTGSCTLILVLAKRIYSISASEEIFQCPSCRPAYVPTACSKRKAPPLKLRSSRGRLISPDSFERWGARLLDLGSSNSSGSLARPLPWRWKNPPNQLWPTPGSICILCPG